MIRYINARYLGDRGRNALECKTPQELVTHTQQWDWAVFSCQTRIFIGFFNGYHRDLFPDLRDGMGSHDSGEEFGQPGASFGAQYIIDWETYQIFQCNTAVVALQELSSIGHERRKPADRPSATIQVAGAMASRTTHTYKYRNWLTAVGEPCRLQWTFA